MSKTALVFRNLKADEIDVRVGQVSKNKTGFSLLLYQDARAAMNLLDEAVGPFNWQKTYSRDNANCTISIWDEDKKQWISKEDVGTESKTEKEKGIASDAMKRAAVNWGIGRELYTAPFIWINGNDTKDSFIVQEIEYDENNNISKLVIYNRTKKRVDFTFPKYTNNTGSKVNPETKPAAKEEKGFRDKNGNFVLCEKCQCVIEERAVAQYSYKTFNKHTYCRECQKTIK